MSQFSIVDSADAAIAQARQSRRDDLGYLFHTFRIQIDDHEIQHEVLSQLIDKGWQLQASPIVMEVSGEVPRHAILSMMHADPQPLRIGGHMEIRGEIRGDIHGELRGR